METLMNLLQETALNHVSSAGVAGNGFGATREMSIRKLIWVATRINIQVDEYSSWGDVVEVDTWVDAGGKNGMRRDWIIRDYNTNKIISRATSNWVNMKRETRRVSKIPDEVRKEIQPFYLNKSVPINVLEDYNMTSMILQFRRECRQSNLLESLTTITVNGEDKKNVRMHTFAAHGRG
ncbi:hypothetical protein SASPL_136409 [Salvia splendens]|uniref:Acyl-[acyl-carrier-protein] hydrolase n=1 Tax=Salvia splendens TaxID=180675 RepID=A0A8X8X1A1_SALSN|nr:hypothetical protein SASPL_136409 [Salvia splendens]